MGLAGQREASEDIQQCLGRTPKRLDIRHQRGTGPLKGFDGKDEALRLGAWTKGQFFHTFYLLS